MAPTIACACPSSHGASWFSSTTSMRAGVVALPVLGLGDRGRTGWRKSRAQLGDLAQQVLDGRVGEGGDQHAERPAGARGPPPGPGSRRPGSGSCPCPAGPTRAPPAAGRSARTPRPGWRSSGTPSAACGQPLNVFGQSQRLARGRPGRGAAGAASRARRVPPVRRNATTPSVVKSVNRGCSSSRWPGCGPAPSNGVVLDRQPGRRAQRVPLDFRHADHGQVGLLAALPQLGAAGVVAVLQLSPSAGLAVGHQQPLGKAARLDLHRAADDREPVLACAPSSITWPSSNCTGRGSHRACRSSRQRSRLS